MGKEFQRKVINIESLPALEDFVYFTDFSSKPFSTEMLIGNAVAKYCAVPGLLNSTSLQIIQDPEAATADDSCTIDIPVPIPPSNIILFSIYFMFPNFKEPNYIVLSAFFTEGDIKYTFALNYDHTHSAIKYLSTSNGYETAKTLTVLPAHSHWNKLTFAFNPLTKRYIYAIFNHEIISLADISGKVETSQATIKNGISIFTQAPANQAIDIRYSQLLVHSTP